MALHRQLRARHGGSLSSARACAVNISRGGAIAGHNRQPPAVAVRPAAAASANPLQRVGRFINNNFFLLGLLTAVGSAKLAPG
jgi:hypothetical protein